MYFIIFPSLVPRTLITLKPISQNEKLYFARLNSGECLFFFNIYFFSKYLEISFYEFLKYFELKSFGPLWHVSRPRRHGLHFQGGFPLKKVLDYWTNLFRVHIRAIVWMVNMCVVWWISLATTFKGSFWIKVFMFFNKYIRNQWLLFLWFCLTNSTNKLWRMSTIEWKHNRVCGKTPLFWVRLQRHMQQLSGRMWWRQQKKIVGTRMIEKDLFDFIYFS